MVRQTTKVIFIELIGGLLVLLAVLIVALAFRLASGPLDIGLFKSDVIEALNEARDGRRTDIGRLTLQWVPEKREVLVVAENVDLYSAAGERAAQADRAELDLNASALLTGRVELRAIELSKGQLSLQETEPGQWSVAGEPLPPIPVRERLPETPAEWLDAINGALPPILNGAKGVTGTLSLQTVSFEGFTIDLLDRSGAAVGSVSNAAGRIEQGAAGILIAMSGGQGDGEDAAKIGLTLETDAAYETLEAELSLGGPVAASVMPALGGEDTPGVDLVLTASAQRETGLSRLVGSGKISPGVVEAFGREIVIRSGQIDADYDALQDQLDVRFEEVSSSLADGAFQISLKEAVYGEGARAFDITSDSLGLDLTPLFETEWTLRDINISGEADFAARAVEFEDARIGLRRGLTMIASGDLRLPDEESEAPLLGDLKARLEGEAEVADVLKYWPPKLGDGARRFAAQRINAGKVVRAEAEMEFAEDTFENGRLKDEHLRVEFDAVEAEVAFLDDLPPVKAASGRGVLTGNSLSVTVSSAEYSGWAVSEGEVKFPKFMPKGEDFTVEAKGTGPVAPIVQVISDSRLQLQAKTGFDPQRLSGTGEASFFMSRPALSDVPMEEVNLDVEGRIREGGLKAAALGLDLVNGSAVMALDNESLTIRGFGDLGAIPIQFTWRDGFLDEGAPADVSASSVITPDVLTNFGLLGRTFLTGEIPVEMQAKAAGDALIAADVALDLNRARLDFSEIGWIKPAGENARVTFSFDEETSGRSASARLIAEDANLEGDITLSENGQLRTADLQRAYLEGTADVSGQITRDADGGLSVSLAGAYLDVSNFVPDFGSVGGGGLADDITIDAEVERLKLRGDISMTRSRFALISTDEGLQSFSAAGELENGKPFEAYYQADSGGGAIRLKSGDAGFVSSAFLGADFLEGGSIEVDGRLNEGEPSDLEVIIKDARLRDAPFLTQILSLASLQGLADTLSGEGVLFSEIEIPLTIARGRYIVDGGKASGPALGLTVNGFVATDNGAISIDGVLVPSFGLNSALGQVPIIGDLVVGRDGEGVFSLTYSVRGALDKAQVSVNPLSAVAPGIIRRIFENPEQTDIPEFETRAPDNPIPSELPPLPPPEEVN